MARIFLMAIMLSGLGLTVARGEGMVKIDPNKKVVTWAVGVGIPDLLHGGVRYQIAQRSRMGACGGYVPLGEQGNLISAGIDHFWSLGKKRKSVWYTRQGINYLRDERDSKADTYAYLTLALGRDFHLIRPYGFSIDVGFIIKFYDDQQQQKTESWLGLNFNPPALPAIRIQGLYGL